MILLADYDDPTALIPQLFGCQLSPFDMGTGRIDELEAQLLGLILSVRSDAMRADDHSPTAWHFLERVYGADAFGPKLIHHLRIVDDRT